MAHTKHFEHLKIQLEDIKLATNNFAKEIGVGGFGKVYYGNIPRFDGFVEVAVKRWLNRKHGQGDPEFWKEITMLSLHKHENIVSLIGFCDDCGERILVYEYLPKGSLDFKLKSDELTWARRLKICIGAARGLTYLHDADGTQQRVLHRDIKSSNILLDKDWNAKISDFGLSKSGPANQEYTFLFSNPAGTAGYIDPLYHKNSYLTKESDVYSFGVVLFEVLCGRLCMDMRDGNEPLLGLVRKYDENTINQIVYDNLMDEINRDSLKVFVTTAYQCLKKDGRPLISDVVRALETALQYQDPANNLVANSSLWPQRSEIIEDHVRTSQPIQLASGVRGFLIVIIHKGNDLEGKHPFVMLRVGHEIKKTATTKYDKNPVWEETFKFTLDNPEKEILHLAVGHDSWRRKEVLGEVDINVADVMIEKQMSNIYRIGNGRLHVELEWEPSALPVKTMPKYKQFMSSVYNLAVS